MYRICPTAGVIIKADHSGRRHVCLIVRRIQVKSFESVDCFASSFDSRIALLPPESGKTLLRAIGIALKSKSLIPAEERDSVIETNYAGNRRTGQAKDDQMKKGMLRCKITSIEM